VVVIDLCALLLPDQSYSELENRNLQGMPAASLTQVTSGRFMEQFEDYVEDQFPLRGGWIQLKSLFDRLLGKRESNGIYLAADGYLIEDFTPPEETQYAALVEGLRTFAAAHPDWKQVMLVAPTAVNIYKEKLPLFAPAGDQDGYLDRLQADAKSAGITYVDVRQAFRGAQDTQLYYRTDHHWTTDGAYLAYLQLAQQWGLRGGQVTYQRLVVSDTFSGTMAASSGFRMGEREELCVYLPEESGVQYSLTYVSEAQTAASFYATEKLDTRDQYGMFCNGNHPQMTIRTTASTGRVLLVFKDSYANCFLPFLVEDYDTIVVVDPRYYYDDLEALAEAEGVNEVLYLYNANTLAEDTALAALLGG
jgi:hypothetical protein